MKLGFVAFPKPPEEYLDFAVEHGFEHMEIDLFGPQQWLSKFHTARIRTLKRQIEERSLTVSFHAPYTLNLSDFIPEIRAANVQYVERLLNVACNLGAKWVTVHPGYGIGIPTLDWIRSKAMEGLKHSLDRLLLIAEKLQVPIALENINPAQPKSEILFLLDKAEEVKQLLSEYNSPMLKFCMDVGHAEISSGFTSFWAVVKERCIAMHVHDNDTYQDLHLVPGNGSINWHEVLTTLQRDGFEGVLNVELFLDEHKVAAKKFLEAILKGRGHAS